MNKSITAGNGNGIRRRSHSAAFHETQKVELKRTIGELNRKLRQLERQDFDIDCSPTEEEEDEEDATFREMARIRTTLKLKRQKLIQLENPGCDGFDESQGILTVLPVIVNSTGCEALNVKLTDLVKQYRAGIAAGKRESMDAFSLRDAIKEQIIHCRVQYADRLPNDTEQETENLANEILEEIFKKKHDADWQQFCDDWLTADDLDGPIEMPDVPENAFSAPIPFPRRTSMAMAMLDGDSSSIAAVMGLGDQKEDEEEGDGVDVDISRMDGDEDEESDDDIEELGSSVVAVESEMKGTMEVITVIDDEDDADDAAADDDAEEELEPVVITVNSKDYDSVIVLDSD